MKLAEALETRTVEEINQYVVALRAFAGGHWPEGKRKQQLITYLEEQLSRTRVARSIWEALKPLDQRFVSYAIANEGRVDLAAFRAHYGTVPESYLAGRPNPYGRRRKLVPLELLFHRERYGYSFGPRATRTVLPDEISAVFAEIAPSPDLTPELEGRLLEVAVPGEDMCCYRLDRTALLASSAGSQTVDDVTSFLRDASDGPLPDEAEAWLSEVARAHAALEVVDRAVILNVRSREALTAIRGDSKAMRLVQLLAGDTVVVPAKSEARFRTRLRELGYGIA
jgi:hypothetical protein